ncbi:SH3 domain-containing protein [Lactobacillus sp. DCY120]|uniref:SH3 domain-containing protein n=1 Tax=Bombilactobacillus apium TaxID=2675299 RepID=A0A850R266_9LACO|nr:SH3 domain-containing protein [Bombilactobacillus apium]NVY97013.1 SH3 domain-containing protein [Bombilactobacillus apium]
MSKIPRAVTLGLICPLLLTGLTVHKSSAATSNSERQQNVQVTNDQKQAKTEAITSKVTPKEVATPEKTAETKAEADQASQASAASSESEKAATPVQATETDASTPAAGQDQAENQQATEQTKAEPEQTTTSTETPTVATHTPAEEPATSANSEQQTPALETPVTTPASDKSDKTEAQTPAPAKTPAETPTVNQEQAKPEAQKEKVVTPAPKAPTSVTPVQKVVPTTPKTATPQQNLAQMKTLISKIMNYTVTASEQQAFLAAIKEGALEGWRQYGILPSITAAQAILESYWGQSQLATDGHNLFGIKGQYEGQSITYPTREYVNGKYITIQAQFRKYPDWASSIIDHGYFLNVNSRYANLIRETDYRRVAQLLSQDGYATDPNYAQSLINFIETYNLQAWDKEITGITPNVPGLNVQAASGSYKFTVDTNIRTAPSTSAQIVGQYKKGETVNYNGKVDSEGYTWLRYTSYNGTTHYVAVVNGSLNQGSQNTQPQKPADTQKPTDTQKPADTQKPTDIQKPQQTVKNESGSYKFTVTTNIRTAASTKAQIVGQYQKGETVNYNGKVDAEGYTWLRYTSYNGTTHYVAVVNGQVSTPAPAKPSAPKPTTPKPQQPTVTNQSGSYRFNSTTNIRTAPSTNAQIVGQYTAGETVRYNGTVQADGYTWMKYQSYSGATHYVAQTGSNYKTPVKASTPAQVHNNRGAYRFNSTTNIRTAPSTNAQIVGQYTAGETVYYTGTVQANGYTWMKYQSYSGRTCYVAATN